MYKIKIYVICSITLMCAFLFGGLLYTAFHDEPVLSASAETRSEEPVIIIDAGHGGEDGGASDNGILEKDINLSIALKLRDMLRAGGFRTEMTRDSDVSIYDDTSETTRQKKVSDLNNRVEIINKYKNNILVSIHQNKFEQPQYFGTQIFYSANLPQSEKLAEEIKRSVTGLLQPENKRELKRADKSIYILSKAEVPAVIVECGFISNPEEAEKLSQEKYQQQMAFAVYCGILSYTARNR